MAVDLAGTAKQVRRAVLVMLDPDPAVPQALRLEAYQVWAPPKSVDFNSRV